MVSIFLYAVIIVTILYGVISFAAASDALLSFLPLVIVSGLVIYFFILRRRRKIRQKKDDARSHEHLVSVIMPQMIRKITTDGLSGLGNEERQHIFALSDRSSEDYSNLHPNELKLLEVAYSNQAIFNMLQLRNSKVSSQILSQLKDIKGTSRFSGAAAARGLAEDFME